jgi:hypothetical protein
MHATAIRSAHSIGNLDDRTPSAWSIRLRSILRSLYRKNEEPKHGSLYRLDGRLLADVGLYREHRLYDPRDKAHEQQGSPLPFALLAMWMPRT